MSHIIQVPFVNVQYSTGVAGIKQYDKMMVKYPIRTSERSEQITITQLILDVQNSP